MQIEINCFDLLSDDVRSHPEFMKMFNSIAVSSKEYFYLFLTWKDNQTFVKSQSKVDEANTAVEKSLSDLKTGLLELSNMSVVTTTLAVQLRSCQEKLNKILSFLPNMFEAKSALERAIPYLQSCIHAQKQRKHCKLTGSGRYTFLASNSLGLSWKSAMDNISEVECSLCSELSPLNAKQLQKLPLIRDKCYYMGMECISDFVLQRELCIADVDICTLRNVVNQIVEFFPVLCVEMGDKFILLDYTGLLLRPNIVHQLMTLNKEIDSKEENDRTMFITDPAHKEGIMFYQRPGPVPLQRKYPQLLTVIMDFVKLHGFAAHVRRRTGTSTSCGVSLEDIQKHVLQNVDG